MEKGSTFGQTELWTRSRSKTAPPSKGCVVDGCWYAFLGDISVWQESHWAGWKIETPLDLAIEREELLSKLHGLAPLWMRSKDTRGWGVQASGYFVSQGYIKLCKCPHLAMNPEPWKGIWYHPPLPKIDFFNWLLCHSKILTDNNLLKHGFHEPSRCRLWKEN